MGVILLLLWFARTFRVMLTFHHVNCVSWTWASHYGAAVISVKLTNDSAQVTILVWCQYFGSRDTVMKKSCRFWRCFNSSSWFGWSSFTLNGLVDCWNVVCSVKHQTSKFNFISSWVTYSLKKYCMTLTFLLLHGESSTLYKLCSLSLCYLFSVIFQITLRLGIFFFFFLKL